MMPYPDHHELANRVIAAVLRAADPSDATRRALVSAPSGPRTHLAVGKAAVAMAAASTDSCSTPWRGLVIAPHGTRASQADLPIIHGDHPVPGEGSLRAGQTVRDLLAIPSLANETLVLLLSGGASSLMTLPVPPLTLVDIVAVTRALLSAGATIHKLNTVRRHTDALKGGRLAALAAPRPVLALVLSDVFDDDLAAIASGPVSPDPTTFADALAVLTRRGLLDAVPNVTRFLRDGTAGLRAETPKPRDPLFANVTSRVIGSNTLAINAAAAALERAGFLSVETRARVTGEAAVTGRELAQRVVAAARGLNMNTSWAVVWGGETTVTVSSEHASAPVFGGRNQEFALAAALELERLDSALARRTTILAFGTDGVDGFAPPGAPPAAGAIMAPDTLAAARSRLLDPAVSLAGHDTYTFFATLHDAGIPAHICTGPTGTNVGDIAAALIIPG